MKIKIHGIKEPIKIHLSNFNFTFPENFSGCVRIFANNDLDLLTSDKIEIIKNISGLKEIVVVSNSFDDIKELDKLLADLNCEKKCELLNDYKYIDRSNIDFSDLNYKYATIPFDYIMYGVKSNKVDISTTIGEKNDQRALDTAFRYDFIELRNMISKIVDEIFYDLDMNSLDDIDKSILVSNWIQKNMQYIDGEKSNVNGTIYYCDNYPKVERDDVFNLAYNHYGVCSSFAQLTSLILNHPSVGCKANLVLANKLGAAHAYCCQQIDGKYYVVDNTWCITRNPNKYDESLKATEFFDGYLLVGKDKIFENENTIKNHTPNDTYFEDIEEYSITRNLIQNSVEKLQLMGVEFSYDIEPVFKQYTLSNDNIKTR